MDRAQGLLGQGLGGIFQAGNAKIGHFYASIPQDHDILRLDIPMDNPPAVGVG